MCKKKIMTFLDRTKTNTQWRTVKRLCRAAKMNSRNVEPGRGNSIFCYLFWDIAWASEMSGDFRISATRTAAVLF